MPIDLVNALAVVLAGRGGALVHLELAVLARVAVLALALVVEAIVGHVDTRAVVLTNVVSVVLRVEYLAYADFFLATFALFFANKFKNEIHN